MSDALEQEVREELLTLATLYPRGASMTDLAGYFGVPVPEISKAITFLQVGGEVCLRGQVVVFEDAIDGPYQVPANTNEGKDPSAVALGKRGGAKGGKARAAALSDERRSEIAKRAAEARWGPKDGGVVITGRNGAPLSDLLQSAAKEIGGAVDEQGHGHLPVLQANGIMREKTATEMLVDRLRPMLADLPKHFPFGMTARDLRNHTNASANVVYEAIQKLVFEGLGIWENEMDGKSNTHRFYVRGMRRLPPALTHNQEAVYEAALAQVKNGRGIVSCTAIDRSLKFSSGTALTVLYALERKDLVRRISPWQREGKKEPAEYEVLPLEPREIEWPEPTEPLLLENEPETYRPTSDGRRIGKQLRRAKADYTRPQEDLFQSLVYRRQFLREELRKLDAIIEHYEQMFAMKP